PSTWPRPPGSAGSARTAPSPRCGTPAARSPPTPTCPATTGPPRSGPDRRGRPGHDGVPRTPAAAAPAATPSARRSAAAGPPGPAPPLRSGAPTEKGTYGRPPRAAADRRGDRRGPAAGRPRAELHLRPDGG